LRFELRRSSPYGSDCGDGSDDLLGRHIILQSSAENARIAAATLRLESHGDLELSATFDPYRLARSIPGERSVAFVDIRTGIPYVGKKQPIGGAPEVQLIHFTSGRCEDFRYSPDGKFIAMARGSNKRGVVRFPAPAGEASRS
jgi:hypothetical protein